MRSHERPLCRQPRFMLLVSLETSPQFPPVPNLVALQVADRQADGFGTETKSFCLEPETYHADPFLCRLDA